jgi:hypothetical protein
MGEFKTVYVRILETKPGFFKRLQKVTKYGITIKKYQKDKKGNWRQCSISRCSPESIHE